MKDLRDLNVQHANDLVAKAQFDYVRGKLGGTLQQLPNTPHHQQVKAAAAAATLTALPDYKATTAAIIRLARTLLGQMAISPSQPNVVGYDVPADPPGGFIAEGAPIPARTLSLNAVRTVLGKIATIFALDATLVRSTDERAQRDFQRIFTTVLRRVENRELLSDTAAVVGGRPAGLLHNAPEFSSGSAPGLETDIEQMFSYVSNGEPIRPYFVTSPRAALWLALQRHDGGAVFPNAKVSGGDIGGIPLLTSGAAGSRLILVDAGRLLVTDEGLDVQSSQQAAIQLDDAPSAGPTNQVSSFQTNAIYCKLQRWVGWVKAGDDVVAFTTISDIDGSPN